MHFTEEQRLAITTHDRPLIVTAGAGSGKTRVLVERFIALLDAHPGWSLPSVVAITFTEKAAREMRDRVRTAIERRIAQAVADDDHQALERWLDHQAALTRARIGTIHALCASLLRANPAEAGVDPAFEVLDETEAAILCDEAIEETLGALAGDESLAALLVAFGVEPVRAVLREYAWTGAAERVVHAIPDDPGDLVERWQAAWGALAEAAQRRFCAASGWHDVFDLPLWDDMPPGDKLTAVWEAARTGCAAAEGCAATDFPAALRSVIGAIDLRVGSKNLWGEDRLAAAKDALRGLREQLIAALEALPPAPDCAADGIDEQAAEWLLRWREAIRLAAACYTRRKQDRAALDFDDLEARARRLLIDHPEVAARYCGDGARAGEFNHILVDEFQDTNPAQRDIVTRLAGLDRAGPDRAGAARSEGRLFVVGDPKQSIYAFRGADVSVFGAVRDDLVARGGAELPLSQSFRAHAGLVGACNDLFGQILGPGDFDDSGYGVGLGVPMTAFRPVPDDPRAAPDHPMTVIAVQRPPDMDPAQMSADDLRRWEAALLADCIHGLVDEGRLIWDRRARHDNLPPGAVIPTFATGQGEGAYRPVQYGDVAVLFQASTHQAQYEDVFKQADLPYLAVGGRGYFDQQEVRDLLNLLAALHNPADDLALAVALRSPLFGLSDEALFALRAEEPGERDPRPLWDAVMDETPPVLLPADEHEALTFARGVLRDLRDEAGRAPIADVLMHAVERTGFQAALTGLSGGARRRGNVEKLIALARASGRVSLGAFNAYARDLSAREIREGEAVIDAGNAVRLMSVHASKGLEFPVVILAETTWTRSPRESLFALDPVAGAACTLPKNHTEDKPPEPFAWRHARILAGQRDQAERRRLLYVAATRAGDHLVVSGAVTEKSSRGAWLWQWLGALGIEGADDLVASDKVGWITREWGRCALWVPVTPPPSLTGRRARSAISPWDALPEGEALERVAPVELPLLRAVPIDRRAPARHLSATQLDKLGGAPVLGYGAFRDSVLHDAPDPLRPVPDRRMDERGFLRVVGEIVHRALQNWLLARNTPRQDLIAMLETFAWERALTDPAQRGQAVARALDLLWRFEMSPLCTQIERAPQVYRELPFVHRLVGEGGERVIHGVIDVVFFDGQTWHVLDYKTAPIPNPKRYHLQVGAYAAAIEASMGQVPEVALYYIHPARLWEVREHEWRAALARLEDDIRAALG